MPLSIDHIGRTYPATEAYVVSQAKIDEFAAALGGEPIATEPKVAPPTFAMVVAFRAWEQLFNDPDVDVSLQRIVHASQSFEWSRALIEGDEVVATLTIADVKFRGTSEWLTVDVHLADLDQQPILTARSVFVHNRPSGADEEAAA